MKVKNVEKKIFVEHKSLMGTSEIDSKFKYVKLARGLPTFGVHFFLVKVGQDIDQDWAFVQAVQMEFECIVYRGNVGEFVCLTMQSSEARSYPASCHAQLGTLCQYSDCGGIRRYTIVLD